MSEMTLLCLQGYLTIVLKLPTNLQPIFLLQIDIITRFLSHRY